ncbi:hypothetical protein E18064_180082 [Elizabethkingia anophelis]|nr:hypothetical protein E18064_180082 [Elizabethkingia anophelis]
MDRALDYGSKGWGFDSSRAHSKTKRPLFSGLFYLYSICILE